MEKAEIEATDMKLSTAATATFPNEAKKSNIYISLNMIEAIE